MHFRRTRHLLFKISGTLAFFLGICLLAGSAQAQANVKVDSSQQLFDVMCALHAAGYGKNLSDANNPTRARLRAEMLRQSGPASDALHEFYKNHVLADDAATLSRYVTFALSVGPPPAYRYQYNRDELPPEVLVLEGFQEILAKFHQEAGLEARWKQMQPEYEREMRRVQLGVQPIVFKATGYLREVVRVRSGRTFTVLVDPMIGSKTAFRNIENHYFIVLSPGGELPVEEVRHSFLHFLLDPLAYRYRAATNAKRGLLNYAARAPRLSNEYKDDFEAYLTECLVRAVELRLEKLDATKLETLLAAQDAGGMVLVRPLYRELQSNFEKAEPAMTYYFADLLHGIHIGEEATRIEKIQFAEGSASRSHLDKGPATEAAAVAPPSELELWLSEGGRQIAARQGAAAVETYERILAKYPGEPRAIYGRAVAAALVGDGEKAKTLFQSLLGAGDGQARLSSEVPPLERAWSHVYLGRIYDLEGSRELALSEYKAALAVQGAPESARLVAQRGIDKAFAAPR